MDDQQRGIYDKYRVTKADGTPIDGGCFVLRPDRDSAARAALLAYAHATKNEELASDIRVWMAAIGPSVDVVEKIETDASDLVGRMVAQYEFDDDSNTANPCDWCKGGERCARCRRMTQDPDHVVAFEYDDGPIMEV